MKVSTDERGSNVTWNRGTVLRTIRQYVTGNGTRGRRGNCPGCGAPKPAHGPCVRCYLQR